MLTVYTKNNCPNCVQAKNILKMKNVEFKEVNVEENMQAYAFMVLEGHKSMPQIYDGDKLFVANGQMGLMRLMREGKLND